VPPVVPVPPLTGVVALWHSATALCHWRWLGTRMALALPGRSSTSAGTSVRAGAVQCRASAASEALVQRYVRGGTVQRPGRRASGDRDLGSPAARLRSLPNERPRRAGAFLSGGLRRDGPAGAAAGDSLAFVHVGFMGSDAADSSNLLRSARYAWARGFHRSSQQSVATRLTVC
jgi:hypothetical protein